MLNISFLACTKVPDSLYCGKWRKISKSHLDLCPTMPNIELVLDNLIYNNVFQFHVPGSITFLVIMQKHTHRQMHTHIDSDEYYMYSCVLQRHNYNGTIRPRPDSI